MANSILVGLDGSACSQAAVQLAISWASQFGAAITGIGVVPRPEIEAPEPVPIGGGAYKEQQDAKLLEEADHRVDELLEQFQAAFREAGRECRAVKKTGEPYEEILLEAQRHDLILLGRQTHFEDLGSQRPDHTLDHVLKAMPRPIVVVPPRPEPGDGVVVAYDGRLQAARSLQAFVATGMQQLGDVEVLSVSSESSEKAEEQASRAIEYLRFHGIQATARPVHSSAAKEDAVLEEVQARKAGLLVMGSQGHSRIREFFLGSVSTRVMENASVPMFLYH